MNLTTAKTALCFGMMMQAEGVWREPVAFLYNGVRLPGLPESELPYVVIYYDASVNEYRLFASSAPIVRPEGRPAVYVVRGGNILYRLYKNENSVFVLYIERESSSDLDVVSSQDTLVWSNTDIITEDDGSVVFEYTEPVPVYE